MLKLVIKGMVLAGIATKLYSGKSGNVKIFFFFEGGGGKIAS